MLLMLLMLCLPLDDCDTTLLLMLCLLRYTWQNCLDLSTYKRLLEKPDRYFIWYEKINGTFDHDALMDYLKEKYAKDII